VSAGTNIKLTAGDEKRIFVGWSFEKSVESGGEIVSTEREFEFRLEPSIVKLGALYVYANYKDSNVFYYDPNGAAVDTGTVNMENNEYYTATFGTDGLIKVTLLEKYFNFAECASTFWDDGTFTREGYVLAEYNTRPDGTGEAYSIGSKFFPKGEGDLPPILYCIWEKATEVDKFLYQDLKMPLPVQQKYAPDWNTDGVVITKYLANESKVTVPETIGGKPVIAIAAGAFLNKGVETLILPKTLQKIEDGAIAGCTSLETIYFPDGVYYVSDAMLDEASYTSFKNLYLNASIAPRYSNTEYGAFAVKLCRVLSSVNEDMIIFVAGSSTYQGLGTDYLNALLEGKYQVINYGTTRTRPCYLYMEALSHYTNEGDVVVFAPENSAYMLGENIIDQRMTIDLEGSNNLYRYIDFSKYTGYFTAIGEMNRDVRYTRVPTRYEVICETTSADRNGDYQNEARAQYEYKSYTDAYYITFNNRIKSKDEGSWSDVANQAANKDYTDPSNPTWTSLDRPELLKIINSAIAAAKASGASVYYSFAPVDANAVVEAARNPEWLAAYDALIAEVYDFDGLLGSSASYVYNHKYFFNCAYHVNDYGRTYRTYRLYLDLCLALGIEDINGFYSVGESFVGCIFEDGASDNGAPLVGVDFLSEDSADSN
ncbi:MAG: leucine-rich repeat protein, partial [Clostridia bacterium]|nr:leucine-rich repeat protein [Clostridia bacterium]